MGYLIICIGPFFYRFMMITDLEMSCWSLARHACMYSTGVGASCPQDGQLMGCAEYLMGWIGYLSWAGLGVSRAGLGSSWAGLRISLAGLSSSWAELGIS